MEYANLLTDLGAVAVAVQETVVSKMMSRNVLTRLEPGRDLYEFQGQRIDYEQILPGRCPDFISRLANRANEKGSVLEALLEMKAESLAGRAS